jgi:membrane protein
VKTPHKDILILIKHLLTFSRRVVRSFLRNRGILLAGGVGYNALLSMVPFFAITITALSYVVDEQLILETVEVEANRLMPMYANPFVKAIESFLDSRTAIGFVGVLVLIFFSSIAFRMLEEAIALIFARPARRLTRKLWVSVLLPYVYVGTLGLTLLTITLVRATVDSLSQHNIEVLGVNLSLAGSANAVLHFFSFVSMVVLFTSIYKVLPVVKVSLKRAFIGGLAAATLWEIAGRFLMYYFSNISLVNMIYGSLTTVIVVLLSMEVASIILLLGAQVIAELQASAAAGLPWYVEPKGADLD